MKKLFIGLAAMLGATAAHASIIPTLSGDPVDIGGGIFRYTYEATLASDQALATGSYFTLYDIVGFSGFGAIASGFTASSQLLGLTPVNVLPNDDATLTNASFVYEGPTLNFDEPTAEVQLGTFEILSTVGVFGFDDFTSEAIRNSGPSRGSLVATIGNDAIAIPGDGNPNPAVPEPESWALMLLGFGFVGASMRRRKTVVAA